MDPRPSLSYDYRGPQSSYYSAHQPPHSGDAMPPRTPLIPSTTVLRVLQRNLAGTVRAQHPHHCLQTLRQHGQPRPASLHKQLRHASFETRQPKGGFLSDAKLFWNHQRRENPILFPFAIVSVTFCMGALVYATYLHAKVRLEMGNYPERVGLKLRRAIYFTDHDPDAAQAAKAYMEALQLAQEEQMHPLTEEVLGIWLAMAHFLDTIGSYPQEIEILENVRRDCMFWVDKFGGLEGNAADRERLMQKAIQMAHKAAELYSLPHIANRDKAEELLVWAVQTTLHENQRRAKEGLRPGEGTFFDQDQQGAQLEAMGQHYEAQDNHYFASQLFLQALMIKPSHDCHSVVLMNNLAASLVQQAPPVERGSPPADRQQLRDSARAWAQRALELGRRIEPPQRTRECDEGCATATHNLGEFLEMEGQVQQARELYEEAHSLAHAIGFEAGVEASRAGVARLAARR